jgi:hypothetical protein
MNFYDTDFLDVIGYIFTGLIIFCISMAVVDANNKVERGISYCAKYGSEWKYKAGRFDHCVNPDGEIKGVY